MEEGNRTLGIVICVVAIVAIVALGAFVYRNGCEQCGAPPPQQQAIAPPPQPVTPAPQPQPVTPAPTYYEPPPQPTYTYTQTCRTRVDIAVSPNPVYLCQGQWLTITGTVTGKRIDPLVRFYLDGASEPFDAIYTTFSFSYKFHPTWLAEGTYHTIEARAQYDGCTEGTDSVTFYVGQCHKQPDSHWGTCCCFSGCTYCCPSCPNCIGQQQPPDNGPTDGSTCIGDKPPYPGSEIPNYAGGQPSGGSQPPPTGGSEAPVSAPVPSN